MNNIFKLSFSLAFSLSLGACSSVQSANYIQEQGCDNAPNVDLKVYCFQQKAELGDPVSAAHLVKHYSREYFKDPELEKKYKVMVMESDNASAILSVLGRDEEEKAVKILEREARDGDSEALESLIQKFGTEPYVNWVSNTGNTALMLTLAEELRYENKALRGAVLEKAASLGSQKALELLSFHDVFDLSDAELHQHHRAMAERGSVSSMNILIRGGEDVDKWVNKAIQKNNIGALKDIHSYLQDDRMKNEANINKIKQALIKYGDIETLKNEVGYLADDQDKYDLFEILGVDTNIGSIISQLENMSIREINSSYADLVKYLNKNRKYKLLDFSLNKHLISSYELGEYIDMNDDSSLLLAARYFAKRDEELSIEIYEALVDKGNEFAHTELLRLYADQGKSFHRSNAQKIFVLLDSMIVTDHVEAMVVKADISFNVNHSEIRKEQFEEALMLYQKAYDKGYRSNEDKLLLLYGGVYMGKFEVNSDLQNKAEAFVSAEAEAGNQMALKILAKVKQM